MSGRKRRPSSVLLHQGYLVKLGFKSGKFQRRYFTLSDTLVYSLTPGGKVKGKLLLSPSTTVCAVPAGDELDSDALADGVFSRSPVPQNAFKVIAQWTGSGLFASGGYRSFYFAADSAQDCDAWIATIQGAIAAGPGFLAGPDAVAPAKPPAEAESPHPASETAVPEATTTEAAKPDTAAVEGATEPDPPPAAAET